MKDALNAAIAALNDVVSTVASLPDASALSDLSSRVSALESGVPQLTYYDEGDEPSLLSHCSSAPLLNGVNASDNTDSAVFTFFANPAAANSWDSGSLQGVEIPYSYGPAAFGLKPAKYALSLGSIDLSTFSGVLVTVIQDGDSSSASGRSIIAASCYFNVDNADQLFLFSVEGPFTIRLSVEAPPQVDNLVSISTLVCVSCDPSSSF